MHSSQDMPVALVSGGGRGIGQAAAWRLASAGYAVAIVSRNIDELRTTAQNIPHALPIVADVSLPTSATVIINQVKDRWGRLDVLVNAAGVAPQMPIVQMSDADWRAVIDTNLSSVFYMLRAAWPLLQHSAAHPAGGKAVHNSGGVIVNLSSLAARDPFEGLGAYGAAKAAVNLLGLAAGREGAACGIRVHTLALGAVETTMLRKLLSVKQLPGDKTLSCEQVAEAIYQCINGPLAHSGGEIIYLHQGTL